MSELLKKLETYADSDYLPMHMPGHKRRMGDLGNPFFIDIINEINSSKMNKILIIHA